jgi:Asp-tRNA(Asn)/Glu-tRNA(Gln) amidotransferase B subunit
MIPQSASQTGYEVVIGVEVHAQLRTQSKGVGQRSACLPTVRPAPSASVCQAAFRSSTRLQSRWPSGRVLP